MGALRMVAGHPGRMRARPNQPAAQPLLQTRPSGGISYSSHPPNCQCSSPTGAVILRPRSRLDARNAQIVLGGHARLHALQRIEHEIGCPHLCQAAIGGLSADKGPVLGELVDRLPPPPHAAILTPFT